MDAAGSCGAAFCLVNTDWSAQGAPTDERLRLDLRFESIDLDQSRAGSDRIAVGAVARHHDEVVTKNRNWVANADWSFAPNWGVAVALPYVDRDHIHLHHHRGERLLETWSFREPGDVRVQGRYAMTSIADDASRMHAWGVTFGAKLPTGKHDLRNGEGAEAERSLQPGTGTTDILVGAFWHGAAPLTGWSWFTRASAVLPATTRDGYKPGRQLQLDTGLRHALTSTVGLMLQANAQVKGRDAGENAEPDDSGQRAIFLSPGISWNASRDMQLYAFVQAPIHQRVNGVQLTADWSALAGVSLRF
jgi:hypothetical protein